MSNRLGANLKSVLEKIAKCSEQRPNVCDNFSE